MNKIKALMITFFLVFAFGVAIPIPNVMAENINLTEKVNDGKTKTEKNIVNLYLFHSKTCSHCKAEIKLLDELTRKYDNLRVYKYEVSDPDNSSLLGEVIHMLDVKTSGVPFTIIGDKTYNGYSNENSKRTFEAIINYYSTHGYQDKVGELINNIELPTYPVEDNSDINEYISNYGNYTIDIPLIGSVNTKDLTIPIVTVLIGLVDGFNPCAMWVLLFLISMLVGMKDKKRMLILGITFLVSSATIYGLFMLTWLNVTTFISKIVIVRMIIALVAITFGIINLMSFFKTKTSGCEVVKDNRRTRILNKIKKLTSERNIFLAIIGIITLAISVNIVELACSAGLPVMYLEILSLNNLNIVYQIIYILLYLLFFLLDDLIIFIIAMTTLKVTGISTKYGKASKLVGGIILILIGVLLIFKPEWLMFNF